MRPQRAAQWVDQPYAYDEATNDSTCSLRILVFFNLPHVQQGANNDADALYWDAYATIEDPRESV